MATEGGTKVKAQIFDEGGDFKFDGVLAQNYAYYLVGLVAKQSGLTFILDETGLPKTDFSLVDDFASSGFEELTPLFESDGFIIYETYKPGTDEGFEVHIPFFAESEADKAIWREWAEEERQEWIDRDTIHYTFVILRDFALNQLRPFCKERRIRWQ